MTTERVALVSFDKRATHIDNIKVYVNTTFVINNAYKRKPHALNTRSKLFIIIYALNTLFC